MVSEPVFCKVTLPMTKRLCLSRSGSTYREYFSVEMDNFTISFPKITAIAPITEIPIIRIKTRIQHEVILNKRLLVEIDKWELGSMYPLGHIVKVLGEVGDLKLIIELNYVILMKIIVYY